MATEITNYKQIVKLDWYAVQGLCIERNWYTLGTNDEYSTLQDMVNMLDLFDGWLWVKHLQDIAEDIKAHSDTDYEVADIMTALNLKCRRWFEED